MPTYEMLWDCGYCETRGLLGKSHRHCPSCGAAQDPDARYFPPPGQEVAVEDHVYVGVDRECPACETPNAADAKFCVNCGGPVQEGAQVELVQDGAGPKARRAERRAALAEQAAANRRRIKKILAGLAGLLVLGAICTGVVVFWTETAQVTVEGHRWERRITIEQYRSVDDGDWCDSMPSGAYSVSRSTQQRGTEQIPDGEDCSTVRSDNGDGTFSTSTQCVTTYRSEPIYDDWCDYTIDRWVYDRTERSSGAGLSPTWPATGVSSCASLGCYREGARSADYLVDLRDGEGQAHECDYDQQKWQGIADGSVWAIEVGVIDGGPRCGTLAAPD